MSGQRQRLEADLMAAEEELDRLERRLVHKPELGPGQGSARADAWQIALLRRQRGQARQEDLRAALNRMDTGEYGRCELCGKRIDPERLEILPAAPLCVSCARAHPQGAMPGPPEDA